MVSRGSVLIALTRIVRRNSLKVIAFDLQNAYLTADDCREKIWAIAGPELGSEPGTTTFLVKKALYAGLKSAGAVRRALLAGTLIDTGGYKPTNADPPGSRCMDTPGN